jgi:PEGA domain-containing protein
MSKKRKKRAPVETSSPVTETPARPRRSGKFFWGLAAGFTCTLLVTIVMDLGWVPLGTRARAESAPAEVPTTRALAISGKIPEGAALLVDGQAIQAHVEGAWTLATVPVASRSVEIRGPSGTWWQTDLSQATSDSLRPLWSGEIVVEASPLLSGDSLYVDGEARGPVPGTVSGIAPGWHVMSLRSGPNLRYEDARAMAPGEVVPLRVPAPPPEGKGRLIVRSRRMEQSGMVETQARAVRVDGRYRGATPLELNVPAGYHSVAVEEPGQPILVQVLRIETGSTRYVQAEYPQDPDLGVQIGKPMRMKPDGPIVVPVRIVPAGAPIEKAFLQMIRQRQAETVQVPLSVSPSDPQIWIGVIPKSLLLPGEPAVAFASGKDVSGKEGCSELVDLYR